MIDLYYDKNRGKRLSKNQLSRRGLFRGDIDLESIGFIELIAEHEIDTDLYIPIDTGDVEIREDGKAYVIYDQVRRKSDLDTGFDVRLVMKQKIHEHRDKIFVSGLGFQFDGQAHKLQTRDAGDLVNWTHVLTAAQGLPIDTPVKIRTEADKTLLIPAGKMVTLITTGIAYRNVVMDASWTLKDNIDQAATDDDAYTVYEAGIDTIWPDDTPIEL